MVANEFVEVEFVVVELRAVKFWRVVEAVVWRAPVESMRRSSEPAPLVRRKKFPENPVVEEATIRLPVVPVALTWKSAERSRDKVVVAPTTNDFRGEEVAERKSPLLTSLSVSPKEAPPVSSASQPKVPPDQVRTLLLWQVERPAPLKRAV